MKRFARYGLLLLLAFSLWGQETDPVLKAYQKNFAKGSLSTKIQVLQGAAEISDVNMGPLFLQAVEFALDNAENLRNETLARELSVLAVRLIGLRSYEPAVYSLWRLFEADESTEVRVEILNALGTIAVENKDILSNLNQWVQGRNALYSTGGQVDKQVIGEAIATLGKLGDASSFSIVFASMVLGYSQEITTKARNALFEINAPLPEMLTRVIEKGSPEEKLEALRIGMEEGRLEAEEKGVVATAALKLGVSTTVSDPAVQETIRQLRYEAAKQLTILKWAPATGTAIRHFDLTNQEYDKGITSQSHLLEAIALLGAMGTREAAAHLSLYLELMNSFKENGQRVEDRIVLTTVTNLGIIGDRVALDDLLYTTYLDYSSPVKKAAREAINTLQGN